MISTRTHRILPAIKTARVETGIGPRHTHGVGGAVRVGGVLVAEVNVVGPEIATAKGSVVGHGEARGAAAREGGVQGRADGQDARVDIVAEQGVGNVGIVPPDLDVVGARGRLVVVARGGAGGVRLVARGPVRLAQEVQGARAGDVELLDVGAGADENV